MRYKLGLPALQTGLKIWSVILFLFHATSASAQWLTQTISISNGWNAVFLHVDASHQDLNSWVAADPQNPIVQIWRWSPPLIAQYIDTPLEPTDQVSGWSSWMRTNPNSVLQRLVDNTAYLVQATSNYTWQIKGKPIAPRHYWNIEGLNLIGFLTVSNAPPKFDAFLAQAPELLNPPEGQASDLEIFRYSGTNLTSNPIRVASSLYRHTSVKRGQAFWIRAGTTFNKYFGPFEVQMNGSSGIDFSDTLSTYSFRLKNFTTNALTVSMKLTPSETYPSNQTAIVGVPPLLLRGALNFTNSEYGYTTLPEGTTNTWTLAGKDQEGSEVEVVLGLDRLAMTNAVGDVLAGVLQFTDSLGYTTVDIPVSGVVSADRTGLWVGEALVTQVGQYLKSYQGGNTNPAVSTNGNYIVSGIDTNLTDVPSWYSLRLIIHNSTNQARLFHQLFYGVGTYSNLVISKKEAALHRAQLDTARRITAVHLPWTQQNAGWSFDGPLKGSNWITTVVTTDYADQRSNPFLHTYHPDHDNLDATFKNQLAEGAESYTIVRTIRLQVLPPGSNFMSRVQGGKQLLGNYRETMQLKGQGSDTRTFESQGVFRLDRISEIATLTDPL